jgi:predicted dehydrogenase
LKIGILGTGNFSEKVFHTFLRNEKIKLVGAFDAFPVEGMLSFPSFNEFLGAVEAVVVLDVLHSDFETLSTIIKKGKDLYIESPSLCTNRQLKHLEMLAYEARCKIQVGLKPRFYGFYNDLEKYHITPRIIDSCRYVKFNKKSTHLSVIDDLMQHDIDVCLKLADSEVKSIYSTAVGVYYKDPDVVNTRIEFYNGCVANLSASKIANKEKHETKFFQNNTYCSIDFINQVLKVQNNVEKEPGSEEHWGVKTTYNQSKDSDDYLAMLDKEMESFYTAITKKIEPSAGIMQYLQLKSVSEKIQEQLERNFTTNA